MESVLSTIFSAALDARYACQPPMRLSEIEPTRAESAAKTVLRSRRSRGSRYFAVIAGPIVLAIKLLAKPSWLMARMDFSGSIPSPWSKPVATIIRSNGSSSRKASAAAMRLSSSVKSKVRFATLGEPCATPWRDKA